MTIEERDAEILVIEDNSLDVQITKIVFRKLKIANNISFVSNGEEALDFLYKRNGYENAPTPDIIYLDLYMPGMNGTEILEIIKSDESISDIPVVMLTGQESGDTISISNNLGASSYVMKPLDAHKIMETILYNDVIKIKFICN